VLLLIGVTDAENSGSRFDTLKLEILLLTRQILKIDSKNIEIKEK
jgi:hypothetical protein